MILLGIFFKLNVPTRKGLRRYVGSGVITWQLFLGTYCHLLTEMVLFRVWIFSCDGLLNYDFCIIIPWSELSWIFSRYCLWRHMLTSEKALLPLAHNYMSSHVKSFSHKRMTSQSIPTPKGNNYGQQKYLANHRGLFHTPNNDCRNLQPLFSVIRHQSQNVNKKYNENINLRKLLLKSK